MNKCACGCGELCNKTYVSGHNFKTESMRDYLSYLGKKRKGRKHSEEAKKKISEAKKGKPGVWLGKKHTEETKEKISNGNKGKSKWRIGVLNSFYGKHHSEETKQKISLANKGKIRFCINKDMSGANNPNWRGGSSKFPYSEEFSYSLKEYIKYKCRYRCKVCNKHEFSLKESLCIHHIDYDKTNSKINNLIALCKSCHSKTNGNRIFWVNYFNRISIPMDQTTYMDYDITNLPPRYQE